MSNLIKNFIMMVIAFTIALFTTHAILLKLYKNRYERIIYARYYEDFHINGYKVIKDNQ